MKGKGEWEQNVEENCGDMDDDNKLKNWSIERKCKNMMILLFILTNASWKGLNRSQFFIDTYHSLTAKYQDRYYQILNFHPNLTKTFYFFKENANECLGCPDEKDERAWVKKYGFEESLFLMHEGNL